MSPAIDLRCLERLKAVLGSVLSRAAVQYGALPTLETLRLLQEADSVLPQSGATRERLRELVGDNPVSTFVYHRLTRELLAARGVHHPTDTVALTAMPGYSQTSEVATRLVEEFESLPWGYSVAFKLPASFSKVFVSHVGSMRLSEGIELLTPPPDYERTHPITEAPRLLLTGYATTSKWETDSAYLQLETSGFIAPYADTAPRDRLLSVVRAFAGLGVALRLFVVAPSFGQFRPRFEYFVHRRVEDRLAFDCECWWDTDQALAFSGLLLDTVGGRLNTDSERAEWMRDVLGRIAVVFAEAEKGRRIRLAAQWLFDSLCASDRPLAFVQAAVVMEVLLGDKLESERIGVTELLANRCAYLIADSQSGRDRLIREFKAIYNLRSDIVHRGKSTLTSSDFVDLLRLQFMCMQVIRKEVELLEKDQR